MNQILSEKESGQLATKIMKEIHALNLEKGEHTFLIQLLLTIHNNRKENYHGRSKSNVSKVCAIG